MLTIKVEGSAGSEILDVMRDMLNFSVRNQVVTLTNINGVEVMIFPHSVPEEVYLKYRESQALGRKFAY